MAHYTYYVSADFWGKYCRGNLVKITISNRFGKLVVVNSDSDPKYSGEVKMILSGQELRMDLLNGEGCYIVSNERHCPQDSVKDMYKKLTDVCHSLCT
jgi:hypothetical protein